MSYGKHNQSNDQINRGESVILITTRQNVYEYSLNTQGTACSPFSIYAGLRIHSNSIPVSRSKTVQKGHPIGCPFLCCTSAKTWSNPLFHPGQQRHTHRTRIRPLMQLSHRSKRFPFRSFHIDGSCPSHCLRSRGGYAFWYRRVLRN